MQIAYLLTRLINFFVGLVVIILGLRVIFRLFNANSTTPFVNWIYDTSSSIMTPFRGIFPPATLERGYVLDVSAIFAIIVYAILGYLLIALIDSVPTRSVVVDKGDKMKRRGLFGR